MNDDKQRLLTTREAAGVLRVCTRTVRKWVQGGRLVAMRTHAGRGGRLRIVLQEIERFVRANGAA